MQCVIISGKGGTGKTTLAASLSYLAGPDAIKADCDVDASNLHLMFEGEDLREEAFFGSKKAFLDPDRCIGCGQCEAVCRFGALSREGSVYRIDPLRCEGCGACVQVCPEGAVALSPEHTGEKYLTRLQDGSHLSRAHLFPGADGSGKLVSEIRKTAQSLNMFRDDLILIDGAPGVGCPVMSSLTGVEYGLIVTEPTLSGFEDFLRVFELTEHFGVKTYVIVNKYDLNPDLSARIEAHCSKNGIPVAGKIPYDKLVNRSNFEGKPLVLYEDSVAGQAIREIWEFMKKEMEE